MKKPEIRKKWEDFIKKYEKYFKSNDENWNDMETKIGDYIEKYNRLPSCCSKEKEVKQMGYWIRNQKSNYSQKICSMKDPDVRKKWEDFIETYEEYFKTKEEIWNDNLNKLIEYIKKNNCLPTRTNADAKAVKLAGWYSLQKSNYLTQSSIMKDPKIREKWEEFIEKYI